MTGEPAGNIKLPYSFARRHGLLITEVSGERARVVYRPGVEPLILNEVRRFAAVPLELEAAESGRFDEILQRFYENDSSGAMQMAGDFSEDLDLQALAEQLPETEDLLDSEDDAPIIRLLNGIFTEAVRENASDIHIEPFESRLQIRFRVDGVLREVLQPSRILAPFIISRIKVMAKLDISEKRLPQDGRISLLIAGRPVDVRVSTIPSAVGERVVLRLLDKQAGRLNLEHLGMDPDSLAALDRLIHQPNGIVLVTGPTGSGKTTTLYAALSRLNRSSRNIMTVEDPIEYNLDGIGQTQVNTRVDMTFARGLRAILRQDPDVVMIGEIRDRETAEIAVQASLTGHLVFSTLHTNTAIGAVTRLRDMGVEPFLLSSTLSGVLSQRLVRVLCPKCRISYEATAAEGRLLGLRPEEKVTIYRPAGCESCSGQGFDGRTGIYELVEIDERLKAMIHEKAGEHEMEEYARHRNPGLRADGIRRVLAGETSLEEVVRVTREEGTTIGM
ncbi:MAG: type II secretion system ATPase GspE [Proteobacteria bacterium]|nr:type II secretion system ATPase GspE [Pseudomonadota bacterium]MBU1737030.1 type II secretion system ATPase GspE [Pseudomonadota bacterium]